MLMINFIDTVIYLVDKYSPNFTQAGKTALMCACGIGNTDVARILLDHGAVIDHCEKVKDLEQCHVATQNLTDH